MKIKITLEEARLLEKSIYEYQASLDILSYLMKQKQINNTYLNQYLKQSEEFYIYQNELKKEIINHYTVFNDKINYFFNFNDSEIEFYEE